MTQEAKKDLILAITHFNLCTNPNSSTEKKTLSRDHAVAYTKEAISKCSSDDKGKINETLAHLGTQYDTLNEQVSQETKEEIDPQQLLQNTKSQLLKTAQATLAPQESQALTISEKSQKLQTCADLKAQLEQLRTNQDLASSYPNHFKQAQTNLNEANRYYSAGNFTLGDEQYGYASDYIKFLQNKIPPPK